MDDLDEHRIRPGQLAAAKNRTPEPIGITAMVTEHERDQIDRAAAAAGMSRAAWARETLLAATTAAEV